MKFLVASDIHGNLENTKKLVELFHQHQADVLVLLGDIYHGYSYQESREIAHVLSNICTRLYLVKGNCDSEMDNLFSPVGMRTIWNLPFKNHQIYFSHGHLGIPNVNFQKGDICCQGHTHIPMIQNYHDIIFCNPGSVTLPRGGSKASYMMIEDKGIYIYDFQNQWIQKLEFEEEL